MYRTDFWTLWEKVRVGCFKRTASKHVYYLGWNGSPAQVGCMRQVLGPGALGRPRGIGWRGRWEGGSGWGIHVYPWMIHVNVWQKPLQYCKVISLQLIKKKDTIKTEDHEASERRNWQVYINQTTHMKNLKELFMQISKKKKQLLKIMNWRRKWQPTPVFLPGESQGQRSLVGCRLWGRTELDTPEAT